MLSVGALSPFFSAVYGSDLTELPLEDPKIEEPQLQYKQQPPRKHPVNEVISQLLSWFKGYYSLDFAPPNPRLRAPLASRVPEKLENVIIGTNVKKIQKLLEDLDSDEDELSDCDSDSVDEDYHARERERLAQLAQKLESHEPFIDLLAASLKRVWPENDKEVDKESPEPAGPLDSTCTSPKRRSMDDDPEEQPGPSKWRRI